MPEFDDLDITGLAVLIGRIIRNIDFILLFPGRVPFILERNAVFYGDLVNESRYCGIAVDLILRRKKRVVIGIIRIVLADIILCGEVVCCQIKKQPCSMVIVINTADDLVDPAFHHQFFDHKPRPDAKAATPRIPALILGQFGVRKVGQKVWVRVHHLRIVLTLLADRSPLGYVVFFIRLIDPVVLIVDIDHAIDRPLINFPFNFGYFHLEIIVHLIDLCLQK